MKPLPPPGAEVTSPCINICRMDARDGWCEGCLRTLDEIALWGGLDASARRHIWQQLSTRRAQRRAARPAPAAGG